MSFFAKLVRASAILAAICTASSGHAGPWDLTLRPTIEHKSILVKPVYPPLGYQLFCLKHFDECRSSASTMVAYDITLHRKLNVVNAFVNRSIIARRDKGDTWSSTGLYGDCEDYALRKRKLLIRIGVPAGALRLATVKTRKGEDHAVLVVRTRNGDYVLDNLNQHLKQRNDTGYQWTGMATANPLHWTGA